MKGRIMRIILASAALVAVFAGAANAADIPAPVYKAPPMVVVDPWTGFYGGVNIGYSWGRWSASSNQRIFNFESFAESPKVDGILGGIQAGYNWRVSPQWLFGIEVDAQITGEKRTLSWIDPELPPTVVPVVADFVPRPGGPATLTSTWEFPWFATLRGRVGYLASPNWLFYATGGLAIGETKYSFTFSQPGAAGNAVGPTTTNYALSSRKTSVGFALGAGTEYRIDRNWSTKFEYLYVDLGTTTINALDIDGAPFRVSYHVRDHIARIGLNYRFDPGPVVARY
jgi:outer membrane immunogenic protein